MEPDVQEWAIEEMAQNRQRKAVKEKASLGRQDLPCVAPEACQYTVHFNTYLPQFTALSIQVMRRLHRCQPSWLHNLKVVDKGALGFIMPDTGHPLKVYPYGKLHKPDDTSRVIFDGHDSRGSSDWIVAVQKNPDILMPNDVQ